MDGSQRELEAVLARYPSAIDHALADFFASVQRDMDLAKLSGASKGALAKLQDFSTRPGKRIRGSLGAWSYDQMASKKLSAPGLRLAVAIELVQNYLLIVDDVMDRSDSRRGKPTIHKLFESEKVLGGDEHLAGMLGVNVGLLALHMAGWVLGTMREKPERVSKASAVFQRNIAATVFGQVDDLYQHISRDVGHSDILRTYYLKSSSYTFVNPLQLGIILAGKDTPKRLAEIDKFGSAAGIAFQLRDDMLGVFGDPKLTGKSNLDDIKEGKLTLLMHYALANASRTQVKELRSYLGNPKFSQANLTRCQKILIDCEAQAFVNKRIKFYAKAAKASASGNRLWSPAAKAFLNQLVDFISERQK